MQNLNTKFSLAILGFSSFFSIMQSSPASNAFQGRKGASDAVALPTHTPPRDRGDMLYP